MRNRTCAVKDRCQWLRKKCADSLCFRLSPEADFEPSALPRTCSCTRGRLAKNIPVRVNQVTVGIENLIRDLPRVNEFFHFFQKNFQGHPPAFSTPSPRKIRTPAKQQYMCFGGRMTLCINKTLPAKAGFILHKSEQLISSRCDSPETAQSLQRPPAASRQG